MLIVGLFFGFTLLLFCNTVSATDTSQTIIQTPTPTPTTDNDAKIAALESQIAVQNQKIDQQGNILDQITNLLRNIFGWNIVTPTPIPVTSPTPTSTPTQTPTPQIIYITVTPTSTPTPQIVYVTVPVTQTSMPTPTVNPFISTPTPSVTISIPQTTSPPAVPMTGAYVRISYIGGWKGTYGMPAALQTVDKSGDLFYEIKNAIGPVHVTAEKLDGSTRHDLVVEIYKNGQLLTSGRTSDAFGKVTVSADATTGVAQTPTPTLTPNPTPVPTTIPSVTPTPQVTSPPPVGTTVQGGPVLVTEGQNQATISVTQNNVIAVKLQENPSTGYQWDATLSPGLVLQSSDYSMNDAAPNMVGVGGIRTWIIMAKDPGAQKFSASYRRSWEPLTGKETSFSMTIIVT